MRIAIISDIHGNAVALETVLNALTAQKIDNILCLGDVASGGPQPQGVLERLQQLGCPVVMGNTDEWLLQPQLKSTTDQFTQWSQDVQLWCSQQLSSLHQAYIRTFQPTIEYPLTDGKLLLGYHGSPRSYREGIIATTLDEEVEQAFAGVKAAIMVGGHTHMQMFRRYKDILILNPGSVGAALDRVSPLNEMHNAPWAEYAIIDAEGNALYVEMQRVPFDLQALAESALKSGMPHAEWWVSEWNDV